MSNAQIQMTNKATISNTPKKIYDLEERTARFGEAISEVILDIESFNHSFGIGIWTLDILE